MDCYPSKPNITRFVKSAKFKLSRVLLHNQKVFFFKQNKNSLNEKN